MKTIDVLQRVDSLDNGPRIESVGKRELHQDPINVIISVQLIDQRLENTLFQGV